MLLSRRSLFAVSAAMLAASRPTVAAEAYTLRLSTGDPATSALGVSLLRYAETVRGRSNGQVRIDVYPSGQLASQQQTVDGLRSGVIDLAMHSSAILEPLLPSFQVFDMPFLFKDEAAAYRVFNGPIGAEFNAQLDAKGILGIGWGSSGFKELSTTSRAIVAPDDMKGLRMRIQSSPIYVALYQALGAIPVVIDTSESFLALQQHTVEGIDLNLDLITTQKYYTLIKHVALSHHVVTLTPLLGSKRSIEALPAPLQRLVKDEGKATMPFWRALRAKQIADDITILKKSGIAFTEIQYPAFRKAMDPVYAQFQSKIGGDLLDRVSRAAGAT